MTTGGLGGVSQLLRLTRLRLWLPARSRQVEGQVGLAVTASSSQAGAMLAVGPRGPAEA
jgi:hypothetical protein